MQTIVKIRTDLGLTQTEFAKKIGASSAQTISNIERGTASVTKRYLRKIVRSFGEDVAKKIIKDEVAKFKTQLEMVAFR